MNMAKSKPKPKKKLVFVVTQGCYSDYHIEAIFSKFDYAKAFKDNLPHSSDASIEEWDLDEKAGFTERVLYNCSMNKKTGEIETEWPFKEMASPRARAGNYHDIYKDTIRTSSFVSQKHARKLAVEARQKWLREKGDK